MTSQTATDREYTDFVRTHRTALVRAARALTADHATAEDLVQTALVKLYLAWPRVRDDARRTAYARRILVNEHHSLWRRAWRRHEVSTDAPDRGAYEPATGPDATLWARVCALPPGQRAVLALRYYEELSDAEIATALGVSRGTVRSQAHRGLAALRRQGVAA